MREEGGFLGVFNPEFMLPGPAGELITRMGAVLDREKFTAMMDEYYSLRGWNGASGLQTEAVLEKLGLSDIASRLRQAGGFAE